MEKRTTNFGRYLTALRVLNGDSLKELAKTYFVDTSTIYKWELGTRKAPYWLVGKIIEHYELNDEEAWKLFRYWLEEHSYDCIKPFVSGLNENQAETMIKFISNIPYLNKEECDKIKEILK